MADGIGVILRYGETKMRILRKVIYIGDYAGKTIYFDTEKNIPLKATSSHMLNSEKTKNNNKFVIVLIFLFSIVSCVFALFNINRIFSGVYTWDTYLFLIVLWAIEFLTCSFILNQAMYKNVKNVELATKTELGNAIRRNNIWNSFGDKKVTFFKKAFWWILTLVVISMNSLFYILFSSDGTLLGHPIAGEIGGISLFGFIPFFSYLLLYENNIIRWFKVVEKYQNRKIGGKYVRK